MNYYLQLVKAQQELDVITLELYKDERLELAEIADKLNQISIDIMTNSRFLYEENERRKKRINKILGINYIVK